MLYWITSNIVLTAFNLLAVIFWMNTTESVSQNDDVFSRRKLFSLIWYGTIIIVSLISADSPVQEVLSNFLSSNFKSIVIIIRRFKRWRSCAKKLWPFRRKWSRPKRIRYRFVHFSTYYSPMKRIKLSFNYFGEDHFCGSAHFWRSYAVHFGRYDPSRNWSCSNCASFQIYFLKLISTETT